jgi:DNA-binding LacI/PurR family transcriptional regulator
MLAEKLRKLLNAQNYIIPPIVLLAVNPRTRESKTIGLIVPEVVHHFFSVINAIIDEAEKISI